MFSFVRKGEPHEPVGRSPRQDQDMAAELSHARRMLESMPINVIECDVKTFKITYANARTIETLRGLRHLIRIDPERIVGESIDVFHKTPHHQQNILANPANLPHRAVIQLGDEYLDLFVTAIRDDSGAYASAMLTWTVVTDQIKMSKRVQEVVEAVAAASSELQATAGSLSATARAAHEEAGAAADASDRAAANVQTVAAASEQLSGSIAEIGRQVTQSAGIAKHAAAESQRANATIAGLSQAATAIGDVVTLINGIAGQTKLLALNATIEAARAGEAGKGFAVVASEVKSLADQTAKATTQIAAQIAEVQTVTKTAVEAIAGIGGTIARMDETSSVIAAAVEQQGAATREIAESVQQAATATETVARGTGAAKSAAGEAGAMSDQVNQAAGELARHATGLREEMEGFLARLYKRRAK